MDEKSSSSSCTTACETCGGNCWRCLWADLCPTWNDESTLVPVINIESGVAVDYT